ncbi:MAG: hypothetical protein JWO13_829 [Acidobacteriales bacterium]|nr:hypothetical protein [Terriglobales bacterium]
MQQSCSMCGGNKAVQVGSSLQKCPVCEGTGKEIQPGLYYCYGIDIVLTALQALSNQSVQILDKPFKWMWAVAQSTGTFTSQVVDGNAKRPFSNQQIHSANAWGTAQNPFPLVQPYVFGVRGQIQVNITDLSNANNTVRLTFIGVELDA